MSSVRGAVSTAVSALLDEPAGGRVAHLGSTVGIELVGLSGPRLVVLDAAPGPGTLPCSVLVSELPAAVLGEPVEVDATGLRAAAWSVRSERWWQPARVRTQGPGAPLADAGPALTAPVDDALRSAGAALRLGDADTAAGLVIGLLGLGPGSTPAADDAIAGWLLAARAAGTRGSALDDLGRRVVAAASQRTTLLSTELLRHAVRGIAARAVVRYVHHPSRANRATVVGLGASSGAATAAGIDLARATLTPRGAAA